MSFLSRGIHISKSWYGCQWTHSIIIYGTSYSRINSQPCCFLEMSKPSKKQGMQIISGFVTNSVLMSLLLSYQKKACLHKHSKAFYVANQSIFWYDNNRDLKMSYLYRSDALVPQEKPTWNTMIINIVFIRLASLSETAIADIVSFYGTEALKTCVSVTRLKSYKLDIMLLFCSLNNNYHHYTVLWMHFLWVNA